MKKKDYYDRLLDRLKEAYSESDIVNILSKRLSNAEIEIGMLKSELEEKEYTIKNYDSEHLSIIKEQKKELHRLRNIEDRFAQEVKEAIKLRRENKNLIIELEQKKKEIQDLISRKYN